MSREKKFDWDKHLEIAGKDVYIQALNLGMGGERKVADEVRRQEFGDAELQLLANTIQLIKFDGEGKWKSGDNQRDLPTLYDKETGKTLGEVLLTHIVTNEEPQLADKPEFSRCFDRYYDDDAVADKKPTRSSVARIASPPGDTES